MVSRKSGAAGVVALLALGLLAALASVWAWPAEAQEKAQFSVWSDSPSRIVVFWGDPKADDAAYAAAFGDSEEYVIRWKASADASTSWDYGDSKSDVPDKDGAAVAVATVGGGSPGDPDVIIKLPVSDDSAGRRGVRGPGHPKHQGRQERLPDRRGGPG